jgi:hypothetical protein
MNTNDESSGQVVSEYVRGSREPVHLHYNLYRNSKFDQSLQGGQFPWGSSLIMLEANVVLVLLHIKEDQDEEQ